MKRAKRAKNTEIEVHEETAEKGEDTLEKLKREVEALKDIEER